MAPIDVSRWGVNQGQVDGSALLVLTSKSIPTGWFKVFDNVTILNLVYMSSHI